MPGCRRGLTVQRRLNVATTERAAVMGTVQLELLPVQAPLQPTKREPLAALALSLPVRSEQLGPWWTRVVPAEK